MKKISWTITIFEDLEHKNPLFMRKYKNANDISKDKTLEDFNCKLSRRFLYDCMYRKKEGGYSLTKFKGKKKQIERYKKLRIRGPKDLKERKNKKI